MTELTTRKEALEYHSQGRPGKIEIVASKPCLTQIDLSLAYTPGVAEPCREIAKDKNKVFDYTARGNLIAVVTDGSAVLGLGNIGPEAAKPVMEGKAVLFKRFADIDVIDLELGTQDVDEIVAAVKAIEPTVSGINLEDISSPRCFEIERRLQEELSIPVFHADQHGTAVITGAALLNAIEIAGKNIKDVRLVVNGAGAAAIACTDLIVSLGVNPENVLMCDSKGVIYAKRTEGMNEYKARFARETDRRSLADAMEGSDVFIGVSVADTVTPEMLLSMTRDPIVLAMANPDPEIPYPLAVETRPDVIMATGRSDFPNQVNNVLGFPFIFRGALDVRATCINKEMLHAAGRPRLRPRTDRVRPRVLHPQAPRPPRHPPRRDRCRHSRHGERRRRQADRPLRVHPAVGRAHGRRARPHEPRREPRTTPQPAHRLSRGRGGEDDHRCGVRRRRAHRQTDPAR